MLQRAVVALVEEQQAKLRAVAEQELKYLSFLSHDLNNNLNSVLLTLHLAAQQFESPADRSQVAATLRDASETIADTVGGMRQILEHARLKEGNAPGGQNVGPVDLPGLAAAVVRQFARDAAAKGLGLTADVPPGAAVDGNRELLALVLQNLLGNAIKYSTRGSVRITAEHRAADPPAVPRGRWVVSVSDQGPGIAPERRAMLFEAFRRGEVHGQPGVGLGLAIAAQAADLLGGELAVDSTVGVGSTFSVGVPDRADRATEAPGPLPIAPAAWGWPVGGHGVAR
jgi:signal transduction histidine kinase